jgi:ABC-type transporter Mla maintaining outer membrane lipid asymmetry ATPase subunit MlaF
MIVTSHHIASSMRMADRLVFLRDRASVSGTPDELLASDDEQVVEFLAAERADPEHTPVAATSGPGAAS